MNQMNQMNYLANKEKNKKKYIETYVRYELAFSGGSGGESYFNM